MSTVKSVETLVTQIGFARTNEVVTILHSCQFAIHQFLKEDTDVQGVIDFLKINTAKVESLISSGYPDACIPGPPAVVQQVIPVDNVWEFLARRAAHRRILIEPESTITVNLN